MPRTVKELMSVVLDAACLGVHDSEAFCKLSPGHHAFWEKIMHRSLEGNIDPTKVPDVDAAAVLSEEEYVNLLEEFSRLHRRSRPSLQPPSQPPMT